MLKLSSFNYNSMVIIGFKFSGDRIRGAAIERLIGAADIWINKASDDRVHVSHSYFKLRRKKGAEEGKKGGCKEEREKEGRIKQNHLQIFHIPLIV